MDSGVSTMIKMLSTLERIVLLPKPLQRELILNLPLLGSILSEHDFQNLLITWCMNSFHFSDDLELLVWEQVDSLLKSDNIDIETLDLFILKMIQMIRNMKLPETLKEVQLWRIVNNALSKQVDVDFLKEHFPIHETLNQKEKNVQYTTILINSVVRCLMIKKVDL
eukprot:UN29684